MFNPKHPGLQILLIFIWAIFVIGIDPDQLYLLAFFLIMPLPFIIKHPKVGIRALITAMPLLILAGLTHLFDREVFWTMYGLTMTRGFWWMITLCAKGGLVILGIATSAAELGIMGISSGMTWLKIPKTFILIFVQTYRYIGLLAGTSRQMSRAYRLRSGGQVGVHIKAWGSFPGQLLVLSLKHAEATHDAMVLRGFGDVDKLQVESQGISRGDLYPTLLWCVVFTWILTML